MVTMSFERPLDNRKAAYGLMSKAELTNKDARAWFRTPPYYMRDLKSWTTGREEEEDERHRDRELHDNIQRDE